MASAPTTAPSLEDQLVALADKHDLTYVSLTLHTLSTGERFFGASAHAKEVTGYSNGFSSTLAGHLSGAITEVNTKRADTPVAVELSPMGEAA